MKKIAVPTKSDVVDDHFGHCEYYTIFTVEDEKIVGIEKFTAPVGCGCKSETAPILKKLGVSIMLAGNMGQGAFDVLTRVGIEVVRGCSGKVETVALEYLNGNISDSQVGCAEHVAHHGSAGHHGCN